MLGQLETKARGYRPAASIIELPAQGALEFLDHLDQLARELMEEKELAYAVSAIEFLHMNKLGNNSKALACGRVTPRRGLLDEYRGIKQPYHNPLFRAATLLALLDDRPWYSCVPEMFAERPWPFFVRSAQTPRSMPWFSLDAGVKLQLIQFEHQELEKELSMRSTEAATVSGSEATPLEIIVHRLIQQYIWRKTEARCGIKYEDFKDKRIKDEKSGKERLAIPGEYLDAKEKVCSDTFLAFRSRREQDFVDYFTSTICSVGQFLPEEDYCVVAEALLGSHSRYSWEDVKTLAMLALSANS
jgi:CRISPR-associated protein Cmx8